MKIQKISQLQQVSRRSLAYTNKPEKIRETSVSGNEFYKTTYTNNIEYISYPQVINFRGCKLNIMDGGTHAKNMKYFAKTLKSDFEILIHDVELNIHDKHRQTKQLKSLLEQLKLYNKQSYIPSGEYIAIPCLAAVPLLNLQDQYNKIMQEDRRFNPENIKANKKNILKFLEKIYKDPQKYREYIKYMDPIGFGIEYAWGVIDEINKLTKKSRNVYLPSGHPADLTLKWMAEERGLKPELYHYIATGEDKDNVVGKMLQEIRDKNWYSFNILALSDANIVGLKDTDWSTDFIYAGWDSCITESARGVYNFTPIREGQKVIGYSFHDEKTNQYPYDEFPLNDKILNLLNFVGKDTESVLATTEETYELLELSPEKRTQSPYCDKLYCVEDVFSKQEIIDKKINLQGTYVDSTLQVFFEKNKDNKIIFKKADCEGSGRPSVITMWGACFAIFNAISNKIDIYRDHPRMDNDFLMHYRYAASYKRNNNYNAYVKYLEEAARIQKLMYPKAAFPEVVKVYEELSDVYLAREEYGKAAGCLDRALYLLANQFFGQSKCKDLALAKKYYQAYTDSFNNTQNYLSDRRRYINASFIDKLFLTEPIMPSDYEKYKEYEVYKKEYEYYNQQFVSFFERLSNICQKMGQEYPATICKKAAKDIENCTSRGTEILRRREDGIYYIGDLYENK